jgi:spore germination cell wall hydrolase CwlJ-like protein
MKALLGRSGGDWTIFGLSLLALSSCTPGAVRQAARPLSPAAKPASLPARNAAPITMPAGPSADLLRMSTIAAGETAPLAAAPPFEPSFASEGDGTRAVQCLTAAIYYEARSEPEDGQRAVAQVVLNRVRDRAFPKSVCGVVYQRSMQSGGCQFSFACDGSTLARRDPKAWDDAERIARAALAGEVYAPVGSATFYHTTAVRPYWAPGLARIGLIGAHVFYRWRGELERDLAFRQRYAGAEPQPGMPTDVADTPPLPPGLTGYASRWEAGVAVHRGGRTEEASPERTTGADTATPVTRAGVRIHYGGGDPGSTGAPDPA